MVLRCVREMMDSIPRINFVARGYGNTMEKLDDSGLDILAPNL
jgi:hypothetical protein